MSSYTPPHNGHLTTTASKHFPQSCQCREVFLYVRHDVLGIFQGTLNALTSEIRSHNRPGVATMISGHLRRSLCCFCGAIPPTTATIYMYITGNHHLRLFFLRCSCMVPSYIAYNPQIFIYLNKSPFKISP